MSQATFSHGLHLARSARMRTDRLRGHPGQALLPWSPSDIELKCNEDSRNYSLLSVTFFPPEAPHTVIFVSLCSRRKETSCGSK